ncbi:CTP synthase, partial [Atractiella rhizophila]
GECFVLDDGSEVDLDLGNYERYLDITLSRVHSITTGRVFRTVIDNERRGDYLGSTVQIIPHVTDEIQAMIEEAARAPVSAEEDEGDNDVCIVELGGTIGDIESMQFVEALRQFQFRVGPSNFALIHVSLVPDIHGEKKTKPTQHSVQDLRGLGLMPDLIACRCSSPIELPVRKKISNFCHVGPDQVLAVHDVASIYHVPLLLKEQGIVKYLMQRLRLDEPVGKRGAENVSRGSQIERRWKEMTITHDRLFDKVTIVLVGKYVSLRDSYTSVVKALEHASFRCEQKLLLEWVDSSHLEHTCQLENPKEYHGAWQKVCSANGVIVPGGFGSRGTEGMMLAAKWAREKGVPFLGICLGFQCAVIEWARNVMGIKGATSTEFDADTKNPVVIFMPEISRTHLGGTQRLGLRPTIFTPESEDWSIVNKLYGSPSTSTIWERHRHRYEVNPTMVDSIQKSGLTFTGRDERGERMQIFEVRNHPFFVGLQSHPELCTRPLNPSPPYLGFVAAASGCLSAQMERQKSYVPPQPQ